MPLEKPSSRHSTVQRPLFTALWVGSVAVGLTVVFWSPLWTGGGLIGGDVYSYYFPQKTFYADRLAAGELPLWNSLAGHGYPLVAESQTGVFYPPNLLLYRVFDVNTAYNVNHLLHYVLAFVFTWLYARQFGLTSSGALFAAVVYTYGWFPARNFLEWAIITGAYLPLALWCVESFLQTRLWRYLILLSAALGLQMLPGHYNLAFITQLVVAVYVPWRVWGTRGDFPEMTGTLRRRCVAAVAVAGLLGLGLAAVQLAPSWELKRISQRATVGAAHDPGYGHIPPLYWSQMAVPWIWYDPQIDLDQALSAMPGPSISSGTNRVEAHLYFGLAPLILIGWGVMSRRFESPLSPGKRRLWWVLALATLVYTSGFLLSVTQYLPGFSYFNGPGRFGVVTTLGVAILAGAVYGPLSARVRRRKVWSAALCALIVVATTADLWLVGRLVTYAGMVKTPPIEARNDSELGRLLSNWPTPVRLYSPGANLPNVLGAAATPPYLGIGPTAYFDPALKMPEPPGDSDSTAYEPATPEQIAWLQRAGVTHVLSFRPLDPRVWPAKPIWQGYDRLLNPAWARFDEPLYLSELLHSRGRVSWADLQSNAQAEIVEYRANRISIRTDSPTGGRLILTDLLYPDWTVTIDGQPADALEADGMYRGVDVPPGARAVVWQYQPRSVYWGGAVSLIAAFLLAAIAHIRFWHPQRFDFLNHDI
jgi:hypothetical protein